MIQATLYVLKCRYEDTLGGGRDAAGGAAKRVELPCHCCAIKLDDVVTSNSEKCGRFCAHWEADGKLEGRSDWQCFHGEDLLTAEKLESIQASKRKSMKCGKNLTIFSVEDVGGAIKVGLYERSKIVRN
jgi:hypothetical protein